MKMFGGWQQAITGVPDGAILQNIYSADIVSWLVKSAEQIMNLYKCDINL